MVRISPLVVTLLSALLLLTDLDTIRTQSLVVSSASSGLIVFPQEENLSEQSAPRPSYTKPSRGRRVPPPIHHPNGRYPHPVDSFLQSLEPFFNGDVPNSFFNPNAEPHLNLHQHHHHQGGNFFQHNVAPPPLPPPPQFTQVFNRPVKRPPPKNSVKFPSDHPTLQSHGVNQFNHHPNNNRPNHFHHKNPFKPKPTVHQQTGFDFSIDSIASLLLVFLLRLDP